MTISLHCLFFYQYAVGLNIVLIEVANRCDYSSVVEHAIADCRVASSILAGRFFIPFFSSNHDYRTNKQITRMIQFYKLQYSTLRIDNCEKSHSNEFFDFIESLLNSIFMTVQTHELRQRCIQCIIQVHNKV